MRASERLGKASSFGQLSERRQLINQVTGRTSAASASSVPVQDLAHNPFNPREELSGLDETAASLAEKGQLTALTVVTSDAFLAAHPDQAGPIGEASWVVLDGNRRLAAAVQAGLESLRVDVNDALAPDAATLLENALVANLHRVDVPPLDEAKAIRDLVKIHGSQNTVAKRLSKSGAWVSQRLALLELAPDLQDKLEAGELKVEAARRIGRMPKEEQPAAVEEAVQTPKPPRQRSTRSAAGERETAASAEPVAELSEQQATPPPVNAVNPAPTPGHGVELHGSTPETIVEALATQLSRDDLKAVVRLLLDHLDDGGKGDVSESKGTRSSARAAS
ncbi:ParB/RepB/Spo0J family partition protein [Streptomyces sp. NPDC048639]|uniref:ParB/RepB/Spo0J family partition protein n=1 Tax=Streptomyces sp. NPDC048639 TaxID=3365581 RepID=UPI003715FDAB